MQAQFNPVNWFEIPVIDFERAKTFYSSVFEVEFEDMEMGNAIMAMFPWDPNKPGSGGSLYKSEEVTPHNQGTTVYISCDDCGVESTRVESNGGQLIMPKTSIGEHGYVALFIDSEGNKVGMHSTN